MKAVVLPKMFSRTCHMDKPKDHVVTYLRIVATHKPRKSEPLHLRFIVGGDRIDYKSKFRTPATETPPAIDTTPTAGTTTIKCRLDCVVSNRDTTFITVNVKDFDINKPMNRILVQSHSTACII